MTIPLPLDQSHERTEKEKNEPSCLQGETSAGEECQNSPIKEIGGPCGLEPTRYGDWERNGRCYDF